ncbi:MAG: amidohydrolase [Actinobacteria bacterium]|nr:amidohydrolase [Actinomycetota bacterium]
MDWRDEDPGLPIKFGPCSNGEYDPEPLSPLVRETIRRARRLSEIKARRTGMTRREFLLSACGAATTLFVLDACTREQMRHEQGRTPGGGYEIPSGATESPDEAREAVGGEEFVFDIQGHLLQYEANPAARDDDFWTLFPQKDCGEDDPRVCFNIEHFVEEIFLKSDTTMTVLSALPIFPESSPLSPEVMEETRQTVLGLCRDDRVLLHAQALPNVGDPSNVRETMRETAERYPIVAWKTFTHFPAAFGDPGNAWRLDDADPNLPQVGEQFIRTAVELGIPTICTHKGFGQGSDYASPADVGPAARAHPDANFVVYHSGFEARQPEGPYDQANPRGIDRLIASLRRAGIGPNQNVYAELGSTWWYVMRDPDQAAHVLGKLLKHVGEDNVVWGTDCLFYGSPQDQIQALRAFQISPEYRERFGYPELTKELKAKILGLNGAGLYGVDPAQVQCELTRRDLEQIRMTLRSGNRTYGPATPAEAETLHAVHQGWP